MEWMARGAVLAAALLTVAGCGGGGGGGSMSGRTPSSSSNSYTAGQFSPSSTLANQCQAPRAGTTDRSGTTFTENMFLRSWTNETYLWYSEVPDTSPGTSTTDTYFRQLKTPLNTASGRAKDRFHFTYTTEEWEQLSESGIEVGYGADWLIIAGQPPRRVVVAYTEPGSPAATQAIPRGAEVLFADGVDVVSAGSSSAVDQINAAFFPATAGESHTFIIRDVAGNQRTVTMSSVAVTHTPVLLSTTIDQSGDTIGYILFNDHIATAESQLISAITNLRNAGIDDLILDIRYNGGGYLDIASELGYMIAGPTNIGGRPFERLVFNDKNPSTNPITGQALTPTPFHTTSQGFSTTPPRGTALPTLNLPRVYVITSSNTCSASESIINSLRGVGVQVYQIGSTTCGKPYGFYPQGNCGTTYFSIQFEGRNAENFGTYPDGFTPQNSPDVGSVDLSGCSVADDFTRALGDPLERRLAAALSFRASGNLSCPAASGLAPDVPLSSKPSMSSTDGVMFKSPARENRIVERPRTGIAF